MMSGADSCMLSAGRVRCSNNKSRCRCVPKASARRDLMLATGISLATAVHAGVESPAHADEQGNYVNMEALKGKDYGKSPMKFTDYDVTAAGVQYKDLRVGTGEYPKVGDLCVVDWQGYTIGYYGRIFEARNKPKGSSFEGNDKDYLRLRIGETKMIPAVQDALLDMKVGGVRRLIIPEDAGYPNGDYKTYQPSPTTFAGNRTLDFVLKSKGFIDKTILIDIELLKGDPLPFKPGQGLELRHPGGIQVWSCNTFVNSIFSIRQSGYDPVVGKIMSIKRRASRYALRIGTQSTERMVQRAHVNMAL